MADDDVDIITLEVMESAVPDPPKKSPKDKRKKKWRKSAHQDPDGRRASRLKTAGPALSNTGF
jgi:hypothetical protein